MNLAVYMIIATLTVFWIGAAFGLAWSVAAGQWRDLDYAARLALDNDEEG